MNNIKNFHSNLLKIDKELHKDIDIYSIDIYISIKRFGGCENVYIVNLLYFIIHTDTEHFKGKNDNKYLILDLTDKYEKVWSGIRSEIKSLNGGKELFYKKKKHARIGSDSDYDLPLNKPLTFATLTIVTKCDFSSCEKLYPQIYLDKCLYEF